MHIVAQAFLVLRDQQVLQVTRGQLATLGYRAQQGRLEAMERLVQTDAPEQVAQRAPKEVRDTPVLPA
jgi:hypothetical protein